MREITVENAAEYLRSTGRLAVGESAEVREVSGGVSNAVLLVTLSARGERFVLKQARGQLRVKEEWLCPIERIWREVETLRICHKLLPETTGRQKPPSFLPTFDPSVPQVLWEDRNNYCYAMTAAPAAHCTWKELLLAGDHTTGIGLATTCGQMLAAIHAGTWDDTAIAARLDDRTFFDQLRIDPYYRHVAKVHPDLAPQIEALIDSVWSHRLCLVHGDFSPKNLLVWPEQVMLIDFEVGHYGDPAFDLGFFLTHLVLKSFHERAASAQPLALVRAFWNTYRGLLAKTVSALELVELERRAVLNLAGCMLARVDGKSPVDYLDLAAQGRVRDVARRWLVEPPGGVDEAVSG